MRNSLPSFSAIIEWENARLSELDRARQMLRGLSTQIGEIEAELKQPPELMILYNPQSIDPALIRELVHEAFHDRPEVEFQLMPAEHGTYYRQKNHGATLASRELVMFVDSDVVPEPGWLAALIGSFRDPKVSIACGNTYIQPDTLYSRAFALFWFFPLRSRTAKLTRSNHFFANNVVFRKDLFLAYRFPDLPLLRGQCVSLAGALRRDGHEIFIQNAARVSHPPPNGLSHYVKRALCEGHDLAHRAEAAGQEGGRRFPLGALGRYKRSMGHSGRKIWRERGEVGLSRLGALGAMVVAAGYHTLALVGESVTRVRPNLIREHMAV